jgi:hypothetical protein
MLSFNESILNFNKTKLEFNGTMFNATLVNENTISKPSIIVLCSIVCVAFFVICIFACRIYICPSTFEEPVLATIDIIPLPEISHVVYIDYIEEYVFVPESTPVKLDELDIPIIET